MITVEKREWQRERKERGDEGWGGGKREKRSEKWTYCKKMCKCRGGWQKTWRKKGSGVEAMTDKMCPLSPLHPLYTSGVFICLFDILPSSSTIWINVSLYALRLIFVFFLSPHRPLNMVCSCALDVLCVFFQWGATGVISINLSFPSVTVLPFSLLSISLLLPPPPFFRHHTLFCTVLLKNIATCLNSFSSFLGLPTTEAGWHRGWAVQHCGFLHV